VRMEVSRWKTRRDAKLGEAELRQLVERLRTTPMSLDLLTLCNEYLEDAKISFAGHDTFAGKQRLCSEILKTWGNIPVENVTVHMAQSYLLGRAKNISNNSFNVYRKEGRRLFEWGKEQQLLSRHAINPFSEVKKKNHEKIKTAPAPIDHVSKAYMAATPEQKELILAYLVTGGRKSEILKWEWCDIDFQNRTYALHTKKSGSGQVKTTYHEMPTLLYDVLERRFKKRHSILPYVFWHKFWDRKKKEWREDRSQNLNRFTERICKKAGVPKFNLHQLRHLATTILKEKGDMGLAKLQRFLRHDHQKTTEIYAGHLEMGTKAQTDFLADFWEKELGETEVSPTKASTIQNKLG
jgi:integrase